MGQPDKNPMTSFKLPVSHLLKNLLKDVADRKNASLSDLVRDAIYTHKTKRRRNLELTGTFVVVRMPKDHVKHLKSISETRGVSLRAAAEGMLNDMLAGTLADPEPEADNAPDLFD